MYRIPDILLITDFSIPVTLNQEGTNVIEVISTDAAGNTAQNSTLITVANAPAGTATIVFPTSDLKTNLQP